MFNSTTLKAIANARAHAARRDILTYSDLPGPSMLTSANKSNHLRFLTSNPNDHAILSAGDPMMRFVVIDPQDKLTLVHSTAPWCDETDINKLIAVIGDELAESPRVTLTRDALDKVAIAIGSDADIQSLSLKTLEREVTDCCNVGATEEKTKITAADLGHEGTTYGNAPAFVVVPTSFPLAPEEKFGLEGHDIKLPIPPGVEADVDPGLKTWAKMIRTTLTTNKTPCNGTGGTLFDPSEVMTFEPENPSDPDNPDEPSEIIGQIGSRLATSFITNATSISFRHEGAKATAQKIDASIMAKYDKFMAVIPKDPAASTTPNTDGPSQTADRSSMSVQDIAQVVAQSLLLTKSSTTSAPATTTASDKTSCDTRSYLPVANPATTAPTS